MADDGVIILRTPNLVPEEGMLWVQRLLGRKEQFFCGPTLHVFHPDTLRLLFARAGFDDVHFVISRPFIEPLRRNSPSANLGDSLRRLKSRSMEAPNAVSTDPRARRSGPSILSLHVAAQVAGRRGRHEGTSPSGSARNDFPAPFYRRGLSFAYFIHEQSLATKSIRKEYPHPRDRFDPLRQNVYVGRNSLINTIAASAGQRSR